MDVEWDTKKTHVMMRLDCAQNRDIILGSMCNSMQFGMTYVCDHPQIKRYSLSLLQLLHLKFQV